MRLMRLLCAFLAGLFLAGAACIPIYSDRPMGDAVVDLAQGNVDWSGLWCWFAEDPYARPCWSVTIKDAPGGVLELDPLAKQRDGAPAGSATLHVRRFPGTTDRFFISEQDSILAGTYMWAVVQRYSSSMLVIWLPNSRMSTFQELIKKGLLPGETLAEPLTGRTIVFDMHTEQRLILRGLQESHLALIADRVAEMVDPFDFLILERVGASEP